MISRDELAVLVRSRTFWACVSIACTSLGAWAHGDVSGPVAAFGGLYALTQVFQRLATANGGSP